MKKSFFKILFLCLCITSEIAAQQIFLTGDLCPSTPAWKLAFSEEFNGNSLDLNKWFTYYPYCPVADQCEYSRTHGEEN